MDIIPGDEWKIPKGNKLTPDMAQRYMEARSVLLLGRVGYQGLGEHKITGVSPNREYVCIARTQCNYFMMGGTGSEWLSMDELILADVLKPFVEPPKPQSDTVSQEDLGGIE